MISKQPGGMYATKLEYHKQHQALMTFAEQLMTIETDSWARLNPFIHSVTVDVEAIDSYQHVNNSVYLRWMDDCARAHSLAVGINCDEAVQFGFGMAVRESRATYLAAAFEGDDLAVGAWVVHNDGKLRITREFQIRRVDDGRTLVQAEIDFVCINIATGRPAKMPQLFKTSYTQFNRGEG